MNKEELITWIRENPNIALEEEDRAAALIITMPRLHWKVAEYVAETLDQSLQTQFAKIIADYFAQKAKFAGAQVLAEAKRQLTHLGEYISKAEFKQ